MAQNVEVNGQIIEFPDGMPAAAIEAAIKANYLAIKPASVPVNQDIEAGKGKPGWLQGLASVANGPLFGFADEIGGALGGAIDYGKQALRPTSLSDLVTGRKDQSFSDLYRANRDTLRGMQDAQKAENPWTTHITQAAASLPIGLVGALGKARTAAEIAPTLGSTLLKGSATGAGYGGLSAAGASTADTPMGLAGDVAAGAALGAVLSPATQLTAKVVGAVGGNVADRFRTASAENTARQKIAEALARDARGEMFTTAQSGPSGQVAARLPKLGEGATIADAGGANTMQLLDTLATLPGRTKQAVTNVQHQRMATEGGRLRTAAETAMDTGGQRLATTVQSLTTDRATAAAPLYGQLRQINLQPSQDLAEVVAAADALGAVKHARTMATARMQPFTIDPANPGAWNAGQPDHIKRGLDQLVTKETKPDGSVSPVGAAVAELRARMIGLMDQATANPQTGQSLYKQARDAFAGPSALIDAANAGRRVLTKDEVSIASALEGMSTSEREAFRIGAYEALHNKLGTQGGRTELMNAWKNDSTREKLQAMFGQDLRSYREFAAELAKESAKRGIQKVNTGSQTAARMAGVADVDSAAIADLAGAAVGAKVNPLEALGSVQNAWGRVSTPQTVRDQMGSILLSSGPQAQANLSQMRIIADQINRNNAALMGSTGLLGSGIIGSNLAPRGLLGQ
jgi:hypothetical protein